MPQIRKKSYRASALLITLIFIILLGLEALMINLILTRDTGSEAVLRGQGVSVKNTANLVLNDLNQVIYADMLNNSLSSADVWDKYKRGGSDTTYSDIATNRYNVRNPESGSNEALGIETSAWVQEYRGNYFHLVGRAKQDATDLLTHRWVVISPACVDGGSGGSGGLTTILTGLEYPGFRTTAVDPVTGRVFFGAAGFGEYGSTNLYSWHTSTGLSTIVTNQSGVGGMAIEVADDGRLFFGEYANGTATDSFWTWKNNILSTLVSGKRGAGRGPDSNPKPLMKLDRRSGRIYWGIYNSGPMYSWKNGTLTTIHSSGANFMGTLALGAEDEAFFVNGETGYKIYRWTEATGLTTVFNLSSAGITNYPDSVAGANSTGRVWFAENNSPARAYMYQIGVGLTTLPGTGHYNFGSPDYYLHDDESQWFQEFSSGHVILADDSSVYTWDPATPGTWTSRPSLAWAFMRMNHAKTMTAYAHWINGAKIYVWSPAKGLSTLPGSFNNPGIVEGAAWSTDDRYLYFGQDDSDPGKLYSWDASTQALSTLVSGLSGQFDYGMYHTIATDPGGWLYFGSDIASGNMYAYHPSAGLTTIISNIEYPGDISTYANPLGGVYFGQWADPGNFYYYNPPGTCSARTY